MDRGDPRGELIVVQYELERTTGEARQTLLRARAQHLVDNHLSDWMGGEVRGPRIALSWRRGFLSELALDYRGADESGLARLLNSPMCRFVRRVALRTNVEQGLVELLGSAYLRGLEALYLGSYRWARYSTRGIAAAFPGLLHLDCDADGIVLVDLAFPVLISLGLAVNGLSFENIEAIEAADCPKLKSLLIWGGREPSRPEPDDEIAAFTPSRWRGLLAAEGVPALHSLQLDNCSFGDELIDAIADSRLLRQLTHLLIDDDELSALGYERLLHRVDAFRHLEQFELRIRDVVAASRVKGRLTAELGSVLVC